MYDDPFDPGWGVEIGYYFYPAAWRQGYATELTAACTTLADDVLRLPALQAVARPENVGSQRVLEKAGFEELRFVPEMERLLHRREPYEAAARSLFNSLDVLENRFAGQRCLRGDRLTEAAPHDRAQLSK